MFTISNQDLADKALAEEFGSYLSAVAAEVVSPINDSAQKAQSSIADSTQKAQSSIASSAHKAQTSIIDSLKLTEKSSLSLIDTLGKIGVELKSTVASVYEGHETTRSNLIGLLKQHRDLAESEAAKQVQQLGLNIHADLVPRLEVLLKDGLVKPIADTVDKSSLLQTEHSKLIAQQLIKEFRSATGETTRELGDLKLHTSALMKMIASIDTEALRRHKQVLMALGAVGVLQIALMVFLFIRSWH